MAVALVRDGEFKAVMQMMAQNHLVDGEAMLKERSLLGLVSEAISIYLCHPREFLTISIIAMSPAIVFVTVAGLGVGGPWALSMAGVLLAIGLSVAVGASTVAVAQHYSTQDVNVSRAYEPVWRRIVSVIYAGVILGTIMAVGAPLIVLMVLPLCAAVFYAVNWSLCTPVAVMEKHRLAATLFRSRQLVSGNWWSVFSTLSFIWVVAIIIGIMVAIPATMIPIEVLGAGSSSSVFIGGIGTITATVVAVPVIAIGYSLLYYDLRCRREDLYLDVLSEESTSDLGSHK